MTRARRLGVELQVASDSCDRLEDPWRDRAIPVRFHDLELSLHALVRALPEPPDGVIAVGDRPTILAAHAARRFGLDWHPPVAVERSRHKALTRQRLREAGLGQPAFAVALDAMPVAAVLARTEHLLPAVVKPVTLSGSRGVIRADTREELAAALDPDSPARSIRTTSARCAIPRPRRWSIEQFVEGREFALEGVVDRGRLQVMALFDKPDPLDGPFFEETIYTTPSRATADRSSGDRDRDRSRRANRSASRTARFTPSVASEPSGVTVLEVAAQTHRRPLRARPWSWSIGSGHRVTLEELLLRHAIGEDISRVAAIARGIRGDDGADSRRRHLSRRRRASTRRCGSGTSPTFASRRSPIRC